MRLFLKSLTFGSHESHRGRRETCRGWRETCRGAGPVSARCCTTTALPALRPCAIGAHRPRASFPWSRRPRLLRLLISSYPRPDDIRTRHFTCRSEFRVPPTGGIGGTQVALSLGLLTWCNPTYRQIKPHLPPIPLISKTNLSGEIYLGGYVLVEYSL